MAIAATSRIFGAAIVTLGLSLCASVARAQHPSPAPQPAALPIAAASDAIIAPIRRIQPAKAALESKPKTKKGGRGAALSEDRSKVGGGRPDQACRASRSAERACQARTKTSSTFGRRRFRRTNRQGTCECCR